MKAAVLVKNGDPKVAFKLQELPDPRPKAQEVCVAVEAFGLNFADVMARLGKYQDCPPLPAVLGYEAVGKVCEIGNDVKNVKVGDRVVAFTRFGSYATKVVTSAKAVVPISDNMPVGEAAALATQYCTAYYAAEEAMRLRKGEHVLIQAAAGGVGTALIQLAKRRGCIIYGAAGSKKKMKYLASLGVDYPINYRKKDCFETVKKLAPNGKIDVVFDSIGGNYVKKGIKLLNAGGRMVCYGAASMSSRGFSLFNNVKVGLGFGLYHPAQFMMSSKSLIGINMLRIADHQPDILQHCLQACVNLAEKNILQPTVGGTFSINELAKAHNLLEFRKSIGKIVVVW